MENQAQKNKPNDSWARLIDETQSHCKHEMPPVPAGTASFVNEALNQWIIITALMCPKCGTLVMARTRTPIITQLEETALRAVKPKKVDKGAN